MSQELENYFSKPSTWKEELNFLRRLLLDTGLREEYKWKQPCYCFQKTNLIILHHFKDYCALGFFKGSLLSDSENLLVKPGENTRAGRQMRFTSTREIQEQKSSITAYIYEAIEAEKAGLKVSYKKTEDYDLPEELSRKLKESKELKSAFESLTPGRQRAYILHISEAKQSTTRESRIEKYRNRILNGKGINDCVCGLSKRKPTCDGSHRLLKKDKSF